MYWENEEGTAKEKVQRIEKVEYTHNDKNHFGIAVYTRKGQVDSIYFESEETRDFIFDNAYPTLNNFIDNMIKMNRGKNE